MSFGFTRMRHLMVTIAVAVLGFGPLSANTDGQTMRPKIAHRSESRPVRHRSRRQRVRRIHRTEVADNLCHSTGKPERNHFSSAPGVLREIIRRMVANYGSLDSLRAHLEMVNTNEQFNTRDTSEGSFSFLRMNGNIQRRIYLRVDWLKPLSESLVVIGNEFELYRPRLGQVIRGNMSNYESVGGALHFMAMSKNELLANYSIMYDGQETVASGVQTWHLLIKPKVGSNYVSVEMWIDRDGMTNQFKINRSAGDSITVLLTKIEKNVAITPSFFRLELPKGTKIIKTE